MKSVALAAVLLMPFVVARASAPLRCSGGAARVMIVPSVHKLLDLNPNYGYARLYDIVAAFRPNLVGVEIRQEDLSRGADYLARNYPKEMVELAARYGDRAFGFDWLGDEVLGAPIPDDWWTRRSPVKRLEREWEASSTPVGGGTRKLAAKLETLSARRDAMERTASPEALASGPYDKVSANYYATVAALTRGTPYGALPRWYAARDRNLAAAVVEEIRRHSGCRIAVVTGADHHGPVVAAIATLSDHVILEPIP